MRYDYHVLELRDRTNITGDDVVRKYRLGGILAGESSTVTCA